MKDASEHSKNQMIVVVKGLIIHNGKALIVQRAHNDAIGGGTWECVGGKIEFGEELEGALVREIEEEAGLKVTVDKLLYATTFRTHPTRQIVLLTYLCKSSSHAVALSKEHMDYRWSNREELQRLLPREIISDFETNDVFLLEDFIEEA